MAGEKSLSFGTGWEVTPYHAVHASQASRPPRELFEGTYHGSEAYRLGAVPVRHELEEAPKPEIPLVVSPNHAA